jgi:hypothetical protein
MNCLRKSFLVVAGLSLAILAMPGTAQQSQNKTYTLKMSNNSGNLLATFNNTSPKQSSSTFGSVDLFVDLANWSIAPAGITVKVNGVDITPSVGIDTNQQGHLKITNIGSVKPKDVLTVAFSTSGGCGDTTWNANVWSGSNIGSGNFFTSQTILSDTLTPVACLAAACNTQSNGFNGVVDVFRSGVNKDGTTFGATCNAVNVFISNSTGDASGQPPDVVHFRWALADTTYATAVFDYVVHYSSALPAAPKVGWLHLDGSLAVDAGSDPNANPQNPVVFVQAPQCLTDQLPAQLATLAANVNSNAGKITVSSTPAGLSAPFPIVIGTERMDVYKMNGSGNTTWWVNRTAGAPHSATDPVMSTPLPLLPGISPVDGVTPLPAPSAPYAVGMQAQGCIPPGGYDPANNEIEYFDIGDQWSKG